MHWGGPAAEYPPLSPQLSTCLPATLRHSHLTAASPRCHRSHRAGADRESCSALTLTLHPNPSPTSNPDQVHKVRDDFASMAPVGCEDLTLTLTLTLTLIGALTPNPSPSPSPSPSPNPSPSPRPNPNPNPSPRPSPKPNPNPRPSPSPSPSPSPNPSPSPSPNPNQVGCEDLCRALSGCCYLLGKGNARAA